MHVVFSPLLSSTQIANVAHPGAPPQISSLLREIRQSLDFAKECVYYNPDLEDRFSNLENRFFDASDDAFGTWGGDPDYPYTELAWDLTTRCRRQDESRALLEIEQALNAFSRLYGTLTQPVFRTGLWIGPLKICRDHVEKTTFEWGEFVGPALAVKLTEDAGSSWAEITGRSVNSQLYVRVDGYVRSKPTIYERMEMNGLWISGLDQRTLARAATLAALPC